MAIDMNNTNNKPIWPQLARTTETSHHIHSGIASGCRLGLKPTPEERLLIIRNYRWTPTTD
ncbi:hypothetical protein FPSE_03185 [Fusarium pseudograminearum CS3096]|uniref:Uncharacterized protein n=1 Tax=Fusarium pseudograminearum (strain CS3096) TaxID=1028729 RepID=K3W1X0_FUSPC|nr:hypothetical protein FPSE_03185 [Fusarium pseudograminearum CS3096]EKJ76635.1 hypothetical protein FPSE_03185 [Fusarium pseudograminearum CS3096]